jgi:signal transduction histidine kinase
MFVWATTILVEVLVYLVSLYFVYVYIFEKDANLLSKILIGSLTVPFVVLLSTKINLVYFDGTNCDREALEGLLSSQYIYFFEILVAILIAVFAIIKYRTKGTSTEFKKQIVYITSGVLIFLLAFSSGNIIGSVTGDWTLAQYGLFGMPIFMGFLAYLIVRFKAFDIKMVGAQALIVSLVLLISSQFFYATSKTDYILDGLSLLVVIIVGFFLIRSVKKEVQRKEELEKLSQSLAIANDRLEELDKQKSEFISIASHQLRTPLTAIRGYISLALEGSYGAIKGTPIEDIMQKMYTIDLRLSQLVEDLLNVSKIEAGRIQYKWESIALEMIAQELYDMFTVLAEKKGLKLHLVKPDTALPMMQLDMNKIKELLSNLIDNAIKYTEKGSVTIKVEQEGTLVRVIIQDTGIGISKEDADKLFGKFIRTETTQKMDSSGSGLGLFIGRTFVEGHGGRVYATSEGVGMGSSFIVELPLVNPNVTT